MNENNAAQAAEQEIREAFELTYAADADDPACASDLSHFTNGWRACLMSQVRAPVADERAVLQKLVDLEDMRLRLRALHESGHGTDYGYYHKALPAAWEAARAALASAPVAGEAQSDDTLKQVYDAFSIGEQARTPSILMANLGNAIRRSRCLSQVENVLSVPTPPEPEDDGLWGEESLLRWGADEKGYAEHFKAALAEWSRRTPVSEEPVYAYRRKGLDDFVTCDRERFDELSAKPHLFETRIFYAAPQASAEDVRNAALEEAAVLVGGHTWAGASKIVSDLIAEHIRALKQPQADKDSAVDESRNLQGNPVDRSADLQGDKDGGQQREGVVTDDMRYAVRFAPSSAHWSERLKEFFGPDAREGIDALERQLREAIAMLDRQQRAGDELTRLRAENQRLRNGVDQDMAEVRHLQALYDSEWRKCKKLRAAFDHPVFAFLLGEGQLHGVDFGEHAPGAVGKWWWRKDLRAALSAPQDAQPKTESRVGTNTGHGHVWARPDGLKVRCGGPGICIMCSKDHAHATQEPSK